MNALSDEQAHLIKESRHRLVSTRRTVSPGMEEILHQPFHVLDHGFIRVVDYMGDDSSVVQAARVSYGRGTRQMSEDQGLINYLMRHRHTTPFEMAEIKLHVKMPIFVARQWFRHRMASINEYSGRYSVLDREFYVPAKANLAVQSVENRQGQGRVLSQSDAQRVIDLLREDAERNYDHYLEMLNQNEAGETVDSTHTGLARELARINLTLGVYTQCYWKIDLHNLMNFLSLRCDPHAQYEIRAYADILLDIMETWVPLAHKAFQEHRLNAITFSAEALKVLRRLLAGEKVTQSDTCMSAREWKEFMTALRA